MALGFLLILSTAAMPRPHCPREHCVSELLLLTLMCVCIHHRSYLSIWSCIWWLSMKMILWEKEKERDAEAVMKCWRDVYTQIIFRFFFCPWRRRHRCDRTSPPEDPRFPLQVTVLACISRFYDTFFVVTAIFWHCTVFSLLHRCASSSSVHERRTETMERRIPWD